MSYPCLGSLFFTHRSLELENVNETELSISMLTHNLTTNKWVDLLSNTKPDLIFLPWALCQCHTFLSERHLDFLSNSLMAWNSSWRNLIYVAVCSRKHISCRLCLVCSFQLQASFESLFPRYIRRRIAFFQLTFRCSIVAQPTIKRKTFDVLA